MTHPDLPDLPPDVAALLADARGTPGAPASERRRVAARLAITVGMAIPAASLAGARVVGHAWITKALAVVTVAGGVTHLATRRPAAHPAATVAHHAAAVHSAPARVVPVEPVAAPTVIAPAVVAPAAIAPVVDAGPTLAAAAPRVDDDRAFQDELALLDRAVAALGHDDVAGASTALDQHARRFPRGRLSPEREALRVRCAAASGDPAAAEAARRRFHQRYPHPTLTVRLGSRGTGPLDSRGSRTSEAPKT